MITTKVSPKNSLKTKTKKIASTLSDGEGINEIKAMQNICFNFKFKKYNKLSCYIRANIDCDNKKSKIPDLIFVEEKPNDKYNTKVIIEIDDSKRVAEQVRKIKKLINDYNLEEGFFYNIEKKNWRKFDNKANEIMINVSYSDYVKLDLDVLLKS